jgi:hypothetical protein
MPAIVMVQTAHSGNMGCATSKPTQPTVGIEDALLDREPLDDDGGESPISPLSPRNDQSRARIDDDAAERAPAPEVRWGDTHRSILRAPIEHRQNARLAHRHAADTSVRVLDREYVTQSGVRCALGGRPQEDGNPLSFQPDVDADADDVAFGRECDSDVVYSFIPTLDHTPSSVSTCDLHGQLELQPDSALYAHERTPDRSCLKLTPGRVSAASASATDSPSSDHHDANGTLRNVSFNSHVSVTVFDAATGCVSFGDSAAAARAAAARFRSTCQ